jgi:hypothetical protein
MAPFAFRIQLCLESGHADENTVIGEIHTQHPSRKIEGETIRFATWPTARNIAYLLEEHS